MIFFFRFQKIAKPDLSHITLEEQSKSSSMQKTVDTILSKFSMYKHLTIAKLTPTNNIGRSKIIDFQIPVESEDSDLKNKAEIEALEEDASCFEIFSLDDDVACQEYEAIDNKCILSEEIEVMQVQESTSDTKKPVKKPSNRPSHYVKSPKVTVVKMDAPAAYVCVTCKSQFSTFEILKEHMQQNITCKRVPLTCETCGKLCDTKKSLYQHSLCHREKNVHVCDECGKSYSNRFNLENHKSSVHGENVDEFGSIYKCKVCDNQFTNRKDLYEHLNEHAENPAVHLCDTCGKCFNSIITLRAHKRVHLNIRNFPCDKCDKRFRTRLQLLQHLHVHTGIKEFVCALCHKNFAKKTSLVTHLRLHTGQTPYQCNQCDQAYPSPNKLKTHLKSHVDADLNNVEILAENEHVDNYK